MLGWLQSHTVIVMVTQDSTPSGQVRSTTTPTGEESVTPVSGPSGLGELSTSMFTESDRKLEAIQRAQVSSLMGADRNKESQEKTQKRQSPASATRPKKYALELWVEIKTSVGVYTTPDEDSYSVNFAIDTINHTYLGCTSMYLAWWAICWPFMERRPTLKQASFMVKASQPVKQSQIFPPGWDTSLGGECDV